MIVKLPPPDDTPMRDFQHRTVQFGLKHRRAIIGNDPGLGKTRCGLEITATLSQVLPKKLKASLQERQEWYDRNYPQLHIKAKPSILVICTKTGMHVWIRETAKWISNVVGDSIDAPVLIEGQKLRRTKLWAQSTFCVCTLETFKYDSDVGGPISERQWDILIIDEAHKIRNRKTLAFKAVKRFALKTPYLILITATPMSRGAQDIWTLMHLCAPKLFPSYWKWVNTFCITVNDEFGMQIVGNKNVDKLGELLSNYMIRFSREDVAPELPKKLRIPIEIQLPPDFQEVYAQLEVAMLTDLSVLLDVPTDTSVGSREVSWVDGSTDESAGEGEGENEDENEEFLLGGRIMADSEGDASGFQSQGRSHILIAPNRLVAMTRARQLMATPKLLDPDYIYGPGFEAIGGWLEDQAEPTDRHVIIYTSFARALPFLETYIHGLFPNVHVYHVKGGMKSSEIGAVEEAFRQDPTSIVVGTIRAAQSYSLETAKAVFMLGYDWDPAANIQAEDRALRLTTVAKGSIPFYYIKVLDTIDEVTLDAVNIKFYNTGQILETLHNYLKSRHEDATVKAASVTADAEVTTDAEVTPMQDRVRDQKNF